MVLIPGTGTPGQVHIRICRKGAVPKDHWTGPLLVPAGSVTLLMFLLIDKYIGL